mmetsp:Transcript_10394/g.15652  ORF Transcript_10394/g.15652 Transcript_10394/m.15652 type:complete len:203 (+) Transcript_10394:29-637(+)
MSSSIRVLKILNHLSPAKCNQTARNNGCSADTGKSKAKRSIDEIEKLWMQLTGQDLGCSSWIKLTQKELDIFSNLTRDHNWIHKAGAGKKGSPFQDTIAHGLLTLSFLSAMVYEVNAKYANEMSLTQIKSMVNYGFDKIRFIGPVLVDNKIRGKFKLKSVGKGNKTNSIRFIFDVIVETMNKETGQITNVMYAEWCGLTIYR